MAEKAQAEWSSGLGDCFEDASTCCYGFWCAPCLSCTVAGRFGENNCLPLCDICSTAIMTVVGIPLIVPPAALSVRAAMRNRYGIKGSLCNDIMVSCCCTYCSWCQMHRELKHRKKVPVVINVQPQTIVSMQPQAFVSMQPQAFVSMQPQGLASMQPQGLASMQPQGLASMQPQGLASMQPQGLAGMQPQVLAGMQPQGLAGMQPQGLAGMQPQGLASMQPQGLASMQPQGLAGMQPQGLASMQPQGLASMQPAPMMMMPANICSTGFVSQPEVAVLS